ncbi:hypothetical protein VZT92_017542 [Zoarces viviparus]|uniref:Uncharacterized protein n=1 Tax=Zoarces viviparus TaxID=48416 RepID=A0AAW1ES32_ZOAVI
MNGLILGFLLCVVNHAFGQGIYVIIGDQVTFPPTENCKNGATLVHRLNGDSTRQVAQWDDVWKPARDYENRMSPNKSVIFNSTNINDDGLYEFTCGSNKIIHLHVVPFTNSSVTEGEPVTLPFFSVTARKRGKFTVERDGKPVLQLDFLSGHVTLGAGFEQRVSVSPLWESQGDLTVTLKMATAGDRGDYLLYVQHDDKTGPREDVSAVRLRVPERVPDQTTSSPPPGCPTQNVTGETQMTTRTAVSVTAVVVFIITATVCVLTGWCMKTRRCMKTRSSRGTPVPGVDQYSDVGVELLNGAPPRGPPEADEGPSLEGSHAESNV